MERRKDRIKAIVQARPYYTNESATAIYYLALVVFAIHNVTNGMNLYGIFRDELYYND